MKRSIPALMGTLACFLMITASNFVHADEPTTNVDVPPVVIVEEEEPATNAPPIVVLEAEEEPEPAETAPTENPFAQSQAARAAAEERIINRLDKAIGKIDTVKSGVDELKEGQKTTHNLLRGLAADAAEGRGSVVTAKAEIEAAAEKAKAEIAEHTGPVVEKAVGDTLTARGYTKSESSSSKPSTTQSASTPQQTTKPEESNCENGICYSKPTAQAQYAQPQRQVHYAQPQQVQPQRQVHYQQQRQQPRRRGFGLFRRW